MGRLHQVYGVLQLHLRVHSIRGIVWSESVSRRLFPLWVVVLLLGQHGRLVCGGVLLSYLLPWCLLTLIEFATSKVFSVRVLLHWCIISRSWRFLHHLFKAFLGFAFVHGEGAVFRRLVDICCLCPGLAVLQRHLLQDPKIHSLR